MSVDLVVTYMYELIKLFGSHSSKHSIYTSTGMSYNSNLSIGGGGIPANGTDFSSDAQDILDHLCTQ